MDSKMPNICCHGYRRPQTSFTSNCNILTPDHQKVRESAISVGLQTDTPEPRLLSRSKSTMGLKQENNFFQRYRDATRLIGKDSALESGQSISRPPYMKEIPIYRTGRMGACWRHLKRVTGPCGENIMFIDGTVKESDCNNYPPHGYPSTRLSPKPFFSSQDIQNYLSRPKTALHYKINENLRKSIPMETNLTNRESEYRNSNLRSISSNSVNSKHCSHRRAIPA